MEWIFAAFMLGLSAGVGVSFAIAEWMARREHREWLKLCDRYEAIVKKLKGGDPVSITRDSSERVK